MKTGTGNRCVKEVEKAKNRYFKNLYENIEKEKDTKGLYKVTNQLLNSRNGTTPQQFFGGRTNFKEASGNG